MRRFVRGNLLLAAACVLLGALYFAARPEPADQRGAGRPVFPEAQPEAVHTIVVEGPNGRVRLERRSAGAEAMPSAGEGAGWRLGEQFGFPAEGWAADELLARLERVTGAERLSDRGGEAYGFDGPNAVRVTLIGAGERVLADFDQAPEGARRGAGTGTFLRPANSGTVYRAPLVPRLTDRPQRWLPARFVQFDSARVAGMELHLDGERVLVLTRSGDALGGWRVQQPVDAQVARVPVERLLAAAGRLVPETIEAAEPGPEHGLDPGELRILLRWTDGTPEAELVLASAGEEERFAATSSLLERPWVVRLAPEGVLELLNSAAELARSVR